jgi:ABC-2 type transport system ATP-binding protein
MSVISDEKTIIVEHLKKVYFVNEKKEGFLGGVKNLIKPSKKQIHALKDITFSINKGELIGFIGPNGAGKTTTLKVLSGLLYPTSGFIQVLGFNPWDKKEEFLKRISLVMGQKNQLWWDLPAIDTFLLNKAIYEVSDKEFKKNLQELSETLEVEDILKTQVRKLSLGQRMKMELIAALIHKPEVLFLDEPTIGLDVVAQQKLRDFIYEYNRNEKATIILTSHNMSDLIDLVKRVIVINEGEIVYIGNLHGLTSEYAKEKVIRVFFSKPVDAKKLEGLGNVKRYSYPQALISVDKEASAFAAAELLQNFPVADLTIEEEPIESIIRRVFKNK